MFVVDLETFKIKPSKKHQSL